MPIELIDSHAHLSHISLEGKIGLLLERAHLVGIKSIINICTTPEEVEKGLLLQNHLPTVYLAAATTPHDVDLEGERAFPSMESFARNGNLVAIGETGLDYHYYAETQEIQKAFLRRYLQLAKECQLPVVIHCREAFADFFKILDESYDGPGVLHCFTGTMEEAQELIQRGWYLSLSGIVTFKKSVELQKIASHIPLNQLLIETDTPYLAPVPYRSQENEPAYLLSTAQYIANLRGIALEDLAHATATNARTLFKI